MKFLIGILALNSFAHLVFCERVTELEYTSRNARINALLSKYVYADKSHLARAKDLAETWIPIASSRIAMPYVILKAVEKGAKAVSTQFGNRLGKAIKPVMYAMIPLIVEDVLSSVPAKGRAMKRVHAMLQKENQGKLQELPGDVQQAILKLDTLIEKFPIHTSLAKLDQDLGTLQIVIQRRHALLMSLPTTTKSLDFIPDNRRLKDLIEKQPESQRHALNVLIAKMRYASSMKLEDVTRPQVFFYGEPGVGKTYFAEKLADVLDLPICEMPLNKVSVSSGDDKNLLGVSAPTIFDLRSVEVANSALIGELATCMINTGVRNPIFFIDEVDEISEDLMTELKIVMDPDRKHVRIPSLGIDLDISRMTFIFAGNQKFDNDALRNRIPTIPFTSLGLTEKRNAQVQVFSRTMNQFHNVLGDELALKIYDAALPHLEFLLVKDADMFPGARVVQEVTNEFLYFVKSRVLNGEEISDEEAEAEITSLLELRKPRA